MPGFPTAPAVQTVTDKLATIAPELGNVPGYYVYLKDPIAGTIYESATVTDSGGNWSIAGVTMGLTYQYSYGVHPNTAYPFKGAYVASNPAIPLGAQLNLANYNPSGLGVRIFDGVMSLAIADPLVAPTVGASVTAANVNMPAGAYTIAYSLLNPAGETNLSPASSGITTTGPNPSILVTLPAVLPVGCTGAKIYVVTGPAGTVGFTGTTLTPDGFAGSSYTAVTISSTPASAVAPVSNTTQAVAANVVATQTHRFTAAMVGQRALVVGCGDAVYGGSLLTTVQSFTDDNHLVLAANAVNSSNRATVYVWSDAMAIADTAALQAGLAALGTLAGTLQVPKPANGRFGFYACNAELQILQGQAILGEIKRASCILDVATVGFNDVQAPTVAASAAAANGNMPAGAYTIGVTYVTARGETGLNAGTPASAPITTTGPNPSILVTFGAIPAGVTSVKVWIMTGPAGTVGYTGVSATSGTSVVLSQAGGITTVAAIAGGGTGYSAGDVLTVVGGTGTATTIKVQQVNAGVITAVGLNGAGNYSVDPTNPVSVTGGTGTGATFNLTLGPSPTVLPVSNTTQLLMRQIGAAYSSVQDLQLAAGKTSTAVLRVQDSSQILNHSLILDGGANPFQVEEYTVTNNAPSAGGHYYSKHEDITAIGGRLGFNLRSYGGSDVINNDVFINCQGQYNRDCGWYLYQTEGIATYACDAENNGKTYYTSLQAPATVSAAGWGGGIRINGGKRMSFDAIWLEGNAQGTVRLDNRIDGLIVRPAALSMYAQDGGGNGLSGIPSLFGRGCEVEDMSVTPELIYTSRRRTLTNDTGTTIQGEFATQITPFVPYVWTLAAATTLWLSTAAAGDANNRFAAQVDGKMTFGPGTTARDTTVYRKGKGVFGTDHSLAHGTQAVTLNGGTVNIDLSLGGYILATISASTTITVSNRQTGQIITLKVIHDGTATVFTITRPATWKVAGGAFTLTNTAGSVDILKMEDDGTNFNEVGRALAVA